MSTALENDDFIETYPYNLLTDIKGEPIGTVLTEDQMNGIEYALNQLMEREKEILLLRYKEGQTLASVAAKFGITKERIHQMEGRAIWKLRAPALYKSIFYGLELARKQIEVHKKEAELNQRWNELLRKQEQLEKEEARYKALAEKFNVEKELFIESVRGKSLEVDADVIYSQVPIEELQLSAITYHCVKYAGKDYVAQLMEMTVDDLRRIRNFGRKRMEEVIEKVLQYTGYDIRKNGG